MQTPDMQPEESPPVRPGQARRPEQGLSRSHHTSSAGGQGDSVHCSCQGNPGPISVTAVVEGREDSPGKTSYRPSSTHRFDIHFVVQSKPHGPTQQTSREWEGAMVRAPRPNDLPANLLWALTTCRGWCSAVCICPRLI